MPLADSFAIEQAAKDDLEAIGGGTATWIIEELQRLPRLDSDRCPALAWQPDEHAEIRRYDVGNYTARFALERDPAGHTVAFVERIFERKALDDFIRTKIAEGEARANEAEDQP
jgi:hypothetical protein